MDGSGGYEYRKEETKLSAQFDFHYGRTPSPGAQTVVPDAVEIDQQTKTPMTTHSHGGCI
jgi:hypothetical protein